MASYITYILYSKIKDRYYIGFTGEEINSRIRRHNTNHKEFTGGVGDWQLTYKEEYADKKSAQQRELEIKSWKSRIKINKLIRVNMRLDSEHPDL